MEAEIIRTRKGGGARHIPAGLISQNLSAFARIAGEGSTNRFQSFIRAYRAFFGLATDRAHYIRKGLADGTIDQALYDSYMAKLSGKDATPLASARTAARTGAAVMDTSSPSVETVYVLSPIGPGNIGIMSTPDVTSLADPYPPGLTDPSQLRNHFWKNFAELTKGWPVQEIHRRYAWAHFPNGQRRHVLLTIERMSEHADIDKQSADQAYSAEIPGITLEVLPDTRMPAW